MVCIRWSRPWSSDQTGHKIKGLVGLEQYPYFASYHIVRLTDLSQAVRCLCIKLCRRGRGGGAQWIQDFPGGAPTPRGGVGEGGNLFGQNSGKSGKSGNHV